MRPDFEGCTSVHAQAIAREMSSAIEAFEQLGLEAAHRACEARRKWILTQLNASWLVPQMLSIPASVAALELAPSFVDFTWPDELRVTFAPGPIPGLAPNCPMGAAVGLPAGQGWIVVRESAIDSSLRSLGLSIRQSTFHELVHVCGEHQYDGIARMNWVAVGALIRIASVPPAPVDVVDALPVAG